MKIKKTFNFLVNQVLKSVILNLKKINKLKLKRGIEFFYSLMTKLYENILVTFVCFSDVKSQQV